VKRRAVFEWVGTAALAITAGLAIAAAQMTFGISRTFVQVALLIVLVAALAGAAWLLWRHWRDLEDDGDWGPGA
jgi:hypothetical protein